MSTNKITEYISILAGSALLLGAFAGCVDDYGYQSSHDGDIRFSVGVPSSWTGGGAAGKEGASTRCLAVNQLEGGDSQPLYLHTLVEDAESNVDGEKPSTKGALIESIEKFPDYFSLSGICDPVEYPDFAFNLKYGKDGKTTPENELLWPGEGKVTFYAVAPYQCEGLSYYTGKYDEGAPKIRYVVHDNTADQIDIMTATATATKTDHSEVELSFGHALAAIKVKTDVNMPACEVTEVKVENVYGTGILDLGTSQWTGEGVKKSFSVGLKKDLPNKPGDYVTGKEHELVGETGGLTLLMIPQVLEADARLTVTFTDKLSNTERTVSGVIGGSDDSKKWEPGKKYTYTVSPNSINVQTTISVRSPKIDVIPGEDTYIQTKYKEDNYVDWLSRTGSEQDTVIPYTGVVYGVEMDIKTTVTQVDKPSVDVIPTTTEGLKVKYVVSDSWPADNTADVKEADITGLKYNAETKKFEGKIKFEGQPVFTSTLAITEVGEKRSENGPYSVTDDTNEESANCYMISAPGHYSLPLVYGNALNNSSAYTISGATEPGMTFFPDYKNQAITQAVIENANDAILMWCDSPDLIQDVKLDGTKKNLLFIVDEDAMARGNALVAVRDSDGKIIWSWHLWVVPPTVAADWKNNSFTLDSKDSKGASHYYTFAPTYIGYTPAHEGNEKRPVSVKIEYVPSFPDLNSVAELGFTSQEINFQQDEIKASAAGDAPYFQWGRKDPMPPGIYDSFTTNSFYGHHFHDSLHVQQADESNASNEHNMRNKPLFNVYSKYTDSRTPANITNGVSVGYTIQYPNQHVMGDDVRFMSPNTTGFDYRMHWHNANQSGFAGEYLQNDGTMYNAWNSTASKRSPNDPAKSSTSVAPNDTYQDSQHFAPVTKTIYDPSPAGYSVPPSGAFLAFARPGNAGQYLPHASYPITRISDYCYSVREYNFYLIGLRDVNLKSTWEWVNDNPIPLGQSWCSFNEITFLPSANIMNANGVENNRNQTYIFVVDQRKVTDYNTLSGMRLSVAISNNSYGFPVLSVKNQ